MAANEVAKMRAKAQGLSEVDAVKASLKAGTKSDGLVDMKLAKKSKKEMEGPCCAPDSSSERYPYGLTLRLDNESMEKLGIDLPDVGEEYTITAKATAIEASANETSDGGKRVSCTLQITKLKVGA